MRNAALLSLIPYVWAIIIIVIGPDKEIGLYVLINFSNGLFVDFFFV